MTCQKCGKEDTDFTHYSEHCIEREIMERENVCFACAFWVNAQQEHKNDPRYFVADGNSYWIGDEHSGSDRGFGGAKFRVTYPDGRVVETTNLWHQGDIPEWLRPEMPDNAKLSGWMVD